MNDPNRQESQRHGVLGWISAHPKTSIALCLFLLLIGTTVLFDQAAKGRVARRIAALRAAGMPTTIEDLQAAMPDIPDDQNMTIPILEQARVLDAIKITEELSSQLPYIGLAPRVPTGRRRPAAQLDAARWYLGEAAPALTVIHEALKVERGCMDIQWKTPAIHILLPELAQIRRVAKTLAIESMVAAEDGNAQLAAEILRDSCRLERSLEGMPALMGALVKMAVNALAYDQIERTINLCGLSDSSLQRLQQVLREQEAPKYYKQALIDERAGFIDTLYWLRTEPAGSINTIAGVPSLPFLKYVPVLRSLDEAAGIRLYNDLIIAVGAPGAKTIANVKDVQLRASALPRYYIHTRALTPSFSRSTELWVIAVAQNRALQATIGCERYRLATGQWPETLTALVPDYLAAVPLDPFDGKPMRYAHIDEGIKIWTISENLVDDGGDIGRLTVRPSSYRSKDKGWVLLNPDLRGRPSETEDN